VHTVREMMYGTRKTFEYGECPRCGCLTLLTVPPDLAEYYPDDYYSLAAPPPPDEGSFVRGIKAVRAAVALRLPAATTDRLVTAGRLPRIFRWTAGLGLSRHSPVADIGCGGGEILQIFARNGFSRLEGFDPYLPEDKALGAHIQLHRMGLDDVPGGFDLIMAHHALEHMPDPRGTMQALADRLAPRGAMLIRTPVADSWAWRHYGVDWVQLDAPRHLHIHTQRSLEMLAARAGLTVFRAFRDSGSLQVWGSELYLRDLPLRGSGRLSSHFSEDELAEFARRSDRLNADGTGDSICLVLRRARPG
jgi:SAM-dependent methyltransferase